MRRALVLLALTAGLASAQERGVTGGGFGGGLGGASDASGSGPPAVTALAARQVGDAPRALVGRADGRLGWVRLETNPPTDEPAGRLPGAVVAVALAPDGGGFALDDRGGLFRVAPGGEPTEVARHAGGAQALVLSPDGTLAATGGNDGVLRVWGAGPEALRDQVAAAEGHGGPVAALCWTEGGLFSAGWDGEVRAWAVRGRKVDARGRPTRVSARELTSVVQAAGGALVVGGFDGALTLVDPGKRKATAWPERPNPEMVRGLVASPDGARALAVLPGEAAVVLLTTNDPAAPLRWVVSPTDGTPPSAVVFTPDGLEALVGRFDGSLRRVRLPAPPAAPSTRGGRP
ncbi:MAG: hypothetical protein M9894_04345 [Planctomycetes bacterium]|nr:hypothetical protein [Planctomycetota bacterium]